MKKPLTTLAGKILRRQVFVITIDDGKVQGYGEAAPLPAFGGEDPITCKETLQTLLPGIEKLCERWIDRDSPANNLGPLEKGLIDTPCARSAIEGALYDWWAKKNNVPVAEIYARQENLFVAEEIPVNALLAGSSTEWGELASGVVAKGWKTIKMKAPAEVAEAITMVQQVREWVGSQVNLRLDVNGGWTEEQTHQFLAQAADAQLEYIEQPLPPEELEASGRLQQKTSIPIALDESIRSSTDVAQVARYQAGSILILKPMVLGGWRETVRAATLARQLQMDIVLSSFLDGSVGRGHATHMAAALGCVDRAQGLATGSLLTTDLTTAPLTPRAGSVQLADAPGLGIGSLVPAE